MTNDEIKQVAIQAKAEGNVVTIRADRLIELCSQAERMEAALRLAQKHAPPPDCTLTRYVADTVRNALEQPSIQG
jgi:hypothetical protein